MWTNFNLLTQGRTIQIYGPSNWKIRVPFDGEEHTLRNEDIFEDYPRRRNQMIFNHDYSRRVLEANEELDEDESDDEGGILYDDPINDEEYFTDSQNGDTD